MAEIVVHKLYEEKERQYIICLLYTSDAYESFGKKTARRWKEELKKSPGTEVVTVLDMVAGSFAVVYNEKFSIEGAE